MNRITTSVLFLLVLVTIITTTTGITLTRETRTPQTSSGFEIKQFMFGARSINIQVLFAIPVLAPPFSSTPTIDPFQYIQAVFFEHPGQPNPIVTLVPLTTTNCPNDSHMDDQGFPTTLALDWTIPIEQFIGANSSKPSRIVVRYNAPHTIPAMISIEQFDEDGFSINLDEQFIYASRDGQFLPGAVSFPDEQNSSLVRLEFFYTEPYRSAEPTPNNFPSLLAFGFPTQFQGNAMTFVSATAVINNGPATSVAPPENFTYEIDGNMATFSFVTSTSMPSGTTSLRFEWLLQTPVGPNMGFEISVTPIMMGQNGLYDLNPGFGKPCIYAESTLEDRITDIRINSDINQPFYLGYPHQEITYTIEISDKRFDWALDTVGSGYRLDLGVAPLFSKDFQWVGCIIPDGNSPGFSMTSVSFPDSMHTFDTATITIDFDDSYPGGPATIECAAAVSTIFVTTLHNAYPQTLPPYTHPPIFFVSGEKRSVIQPYVGPKPPLSVAQTVSTTSFPRWYGGGNENRIEWLFKTNWKNMIKDSHLTFTLTKREPFIVQDVVGPFTWSSFKWDQVTTLPSALPLDGEYYLQPDKSSDTTSVYSRFNPDIIFNQFDDFATLETLSLFSYSYSYENYPTEQGEPFDFKTIGGVTLPLGVQGPTFDFIIRSNGLILDSLPLLLSPLHIPSISLSAISSPGSYSVQLPPGSTEIPFQLNWDNVPVYFPTTEQLVGISEDSIWKRFSNLMIYSGTYFTIEWEYDEEITGPITVVETSQLTWAPFIFSKIANSVLFTYYSETTPVITPATPYPSFEFTLKTTKPIPAEGLAFSAKATITADHPNPVPANIPIQALEITPEKLDTLIQVQIPTAPETSSGSAVYLPFASFDSPQSPSTTTTVVLFIPVDSVIGWVHMGWTGAALTSRIELISFPLISATPTPVFATEPVVLTILKEDGPVDVTPTTFAPLLATIDPHRRYSFVFIRITYTYPLPGNPSETGTKIQHSSPFTLTQSCSRPTTPPISIPNTDVDFGTTCLAPKPICALSGQCQAPPVAPPTPTNPQCKNCNSTNTTSCDTKCNCKPGWSGLTCDQSDQCPADAVETKCQKNHGYLTAANRGDNQCASSECTCINNWTGTRCQTCTMECLNQGKIYNDCLRCGCVEGFVGTECQCRSLKATILINASNDLVTLTKGLISSSSQKAPFPIDNITSDGDYPFNTISDIELDFLAMLKDLWVEFQPELVGVPTPTALTNGQLSFTINPSVQSPTKTLFTFTITFGCSESNPAIQNSDDFAEKWTQFVSKFTSLTQVKKHFTFTSTTPPETTIDPTPPTLPPDGEEYTEPNGTSQFTLSFFAIMITIALVIS